jgi:hypothetical protein
VEQLGAGSGAECVETFPKPALKLVAFQSWRLRRPYAPARILA